MTRAAIIGLGWWGKVMVEAAAAQPGALQFTHAFVRHPDAVRDYARANKLILHSSFDAALADPSIDAIVLATPHSAHVDQIIACADAGKPVFSEKPLALSLSEARCAVHACESRNVVLGLGTDRRMLPAMLRLRELIETGSLGELLQLEAQYSNDNMSVGLSGDWRQSAHEAPAGGMTGPGLHALDALIALGGPLSALSGQLTQPQGAQVPVDALTLMGRFTSGATMLLGCVRGVPNYFRVAVFGTKGWAELRGFGELVWHIKSQQPCREEYSDALAIAPILHAFADAVEGKAGFPVTTTSMLDVVAGFEAALQAFARPGQFVSVQGGRP